MKTKNYVFINLLVWGALILFAPAVQAQTETELIGLFTIEQGSNFFMSLSFTPEVVRVDTLGSGTDGGLMTGRFQPDPPPTPVGPDETGSDRIIDPSSFVMWGQPAYVSTNELDPRTGGILAVPTVRDLGDGILTGDLSAWDMLWSGTHYNMGAPEPMCGVPAPVGHYDRATGIYTLSWYSLLPSGPWPCSDRAEFYLTGHFIPADSDCDADGIPDSFDNCVCHTNPDQADLDGDGIGDRCDPDADGDGYGADDCDDLDPSINPSAAEICGNDVDENCDGLAPQCYLHDLSIVNLRVPKKVRDCSSRPKKIAVTLENRGEVTEQVQLDLYANFELQESKTVILDPGALGRVVFRMDPSTLRLDSLWCVEAVIAGPDLTPDDNKACGLTTLVHCP